MWLFILKRIAQAIPVMLIVITVTFFMVRAAPGGPFDDERDVPPEVLKNLNARYNLDASVWQQYTDYLLNLMRGDFGPSFKYTSRPINEMIGFGLDRKSTRLNSSH